MTVVCVPKSHCRGSCRVLLGARTFFKLISERGGTFRAPETAATAPLRYLTTDMYVLLAQADRPSLNIHDLYADVRSILRLDLSIVAAVVGSGDTRRHSPAVRYFKQN